MFNARAFGTGRSALHLKECSGFLTIAFVILVGQFVIVTCGYGFFNVVPPQMERLADNHLRNIYCFLGWRTLSRHASSALTVTIPCR